MFGLRYPIVVLAAGIGEVIEARRELRGLLAAVRQARGAAAPEVAQLEELLNYLRRIDDEA